MKRIPLHLQAITLVFLSLFTLTSCSSDDDDDDDSGNWTDQSVFDVDVVLPVRYFTIQAIDSKGKRYNFVFMFIESLIAKY